ncbi:MAG: hypothetical protein WCB34_09350 [Methylovirgula sp.]
MVGMVIKKSFLRTAAVVSALALVSSPFYPVGALATPTRLECTLTSAGADGKQTTRKISIVFDAEAKTLDFYQGSQRQALAHVTISTISIDGYTDNMSIGIDRSSWAIVVQTYLPDHTLAEFGACKPATMPAH